MEFIHNCMAFHGSEIERILPVLGRHCSIEGLSGAMVHVYRADIDGLRAVAVTSIVLFHAKFATFVSGGFVGVDIFFVISGYLITRAIQDELVVGDFSLIRFYGKRIRRICPALLVMLFACTGFAAMAVSPQELKSYGTYLTSSALFVSNILYAKQIDYFAPASEQIPLLHTWSLSEREWIAKNASDTGASPPTVLEGSIILQLS